MFQAAFGVYSLEQHGREREREREWERGTHFRETNKHETLVIEEAK